MSSIPRTGHTLWCQSGEVVPSLPWLACLHRSGQPWGSQAGKTAPPSSTVGLHRPGVSLRIQDGETVPHSSKAGLYRVILALGSQVGEAVSLSSTVAQCPIFNIWPPQDLPAGLLLHGLDSKGRTGPGELGQGSCAPSSKAALPMVVQTLSFMTGVPRTEQVLGCQVGEDVPQFSTTGLSRPSQALGTQAWNAHPPFHSWLLQSWSCPWGPGHGSCHPWLASTDLDWPWEYRLLKLSPCLPLLSIQDLDWPLGSCTILFHG